MISRYGIFCKVIELGSFTKVAEQVGYSQSAISQTVKGLEQEIGVTLIDRRKDGIALTADGREFLPYLKAIHASEMALEEKRREMEGLENSIIRIGTFTSVSRNILPRLMKAFKERYPGITFVLCQGEYTSIERWIQEGSVDLGFTNADFASGLEAHSLYEEEMRAVLPAGHPLAAKPRLTLKDLTRSPFILLDEGERSVTLEAFQRLRLSPEIAYEVYDDYTILAMVRQGLGISLMYERVLTEFDQELSVCAVVNPPKRTVSLAWRIWDVLPYASRCFVDFIREKVNS